MTTEERVGKLEKNFNKAKVCSRWLLVIVVITTGLLFWGTFSKPETVRANRIYLEDEKGTPRILMVVDENGARIGLSDEEGRPRIGIYVTKNGPGMIFWDGKGEEMWSAP